MRQSYLSWSRTPAGAFLAAVGWSVFFWAIAALTLDVDLWLLKALFTGGAAGLGGAYRASRVERGLSVRQTSKLGIGLIFAGLGIFAIVLVVYAATN